MQCSSDPCSACLCVMELIGFSNDQWPGSTLGQGVEAAVMLMRGSRTE